MRAVATIDGAALRHNLDCIRARVAKQEIWVAVKADAYGHGAVSVTRALQEGADGFLVSNLQEALQLRQAGIQQPIITLSQPLTPAICATAAHHDIRPVVFDEADLQALTEYQGPPVAVWLKVDSGMHRLGFAPDQTRSLDRQLANLEQVQPLGWLTHLACADELDNDMTNQQIRIFQSAVADLSGQRSIANSAGILEWPQAHADVVRPGLAIYGCSPVGGKTADAYELWPAMHLSAPIISRRRVAAGAPIGYGSTWHAPEDMEVAVVGIGYGDGYPRHAPSGTPVLVRGQRACLVGRISMDMLTIDVRHVPRARVGDWVTLWGRGLPAEEIATAAQTIPHELFCQLTSRVTFRWR